MPGLGARLGRGAATTTLQDLASSDCIVIMGANMAENHPVGFRFVVEAKERGATVIHVDPRFTRTSALADIHVPLRAGSDLAFLGGLIAWVLEHDAWFREYALAYTNIADIVDPAYQGPEDLAGVFSGLDPDARIYDSKTWARAGVATDPTLEHPNCVYQILRRHYSRYTPTMVEAICGVPEALFRRVAEAICANSGRDRTTAFAYAVAWTQHTTGTQMISCCAMLQLLLGNIGRPGGGILALRGHATIQGSTDIPTLFNLLPGYLPMPVAGDRDATLAGYLDAVVARGGMWSEAPAYVVSLLKAFYGGHATPENDFAWDTLPRISGDLSFQRMLTMMRDGEMRGLLCLGMNPAVGGQNGRLARRALAELDWLVVRDCFEIETAAFWYDAPEVANGEISPADIGTEVFLLPAALTPEKDGSYTNTQRLVQWHDKAVDPPGDCRSEAWFLHELRRLLLERYEGDDSPAARQLRAVAWEYPVAHEIDGPDLQVVLEEVSGRDLVAGRQVAGFGDLRADGSTACGCWFYSGIAPAAGVNLARRRTGDAGAALEWGFAWPANRRLLYNRASADPDGRPWSARKAWVWWDDEAGRWTGHDVPDFPATRRPDYAPPADATGFAAVAGTAPFIMMERGLGALFSASGLKDGPLPAHYEPWETPVGNLLYPQTPHNPAAIAIDRPDNPYHAIADQRFPHVITTYRLTEHYTAGGMSRWVPWLAELQPAGFAEIDPVLAAREGIGSGDWVTITTLRGNIETRALVTPRLQPLTVAGKQLHQVGVPWHFGYGGIATGGIANDLSALVEDPNSLIHEGKAFTCALRRGRLLEGAR